MMKNSLDTNYIYGNSETVFFDVLSPILIGFFVFFFVFLISGIGLLKERTTGTLERLMSTPIRRGEIVNCLPGWLWDFRHYSNGDRCILFDQCTRYRACRFHLECDPH